MEPLPVPKHVISFPCLLMVPQAKKKYYLLLSLQNKSTGCNVEKIILAVEFFL